MQLIRDNPVTAMFFAFFLASCAFSYIPWQMKAFCIVVSLGLLLLLLIRKPFDRQL